jgi:ribosomal protein L21E
LNKARDRVARRYNLQRREAQFQVGDLVLVKLHPQSSKTLQRSAKIAKKWSDPLVIAKYLTPVTVQLANQETGVVVREAHVSQLKKYFPNA